MTLFALLAALTTAQATASAPPVVWETPPRIEMPAKALETGVKSGVVVLRCDFTANGIPTNCLIVSETPVGQGFGREALRGGRTGRAQSGQAGMREITLTFETR
ncbi:hypothetical protein [Brevundimonas sp.]|uniref:hypothetical protein n=1 Tax=Brevundimonas sp. TaxID=1871086 RepID=UPI0025C6385D|nr:hypothetical protein [Brevundimonas sp.]MCG2663948.1 energy transducer TonB [Brevundimonas sp.]